MRKSSSRPRLSQPSGDGSKTVEFFFHSAHFPILGELTKIGVKNVSTLQTISSIRWTFWGIFSSQTFCAFLTNSDKMSRCMTFLSVLKTHLNLMSFARKKKAFLTTVLIPNCNIREFLPEAAEISKMCTMKKNSTVWLPSPDGCDNRGRLDDIFIMSATVEL